MTTILPDTPVSPLRQRLIDDINMRHFSMATQRNCIRDVGRFATFLRRLLDDDYRGCAPIPARPERGRRSGADHE